MLGKSNVNLALGFPYSASKGLKENIKKCCSYSFNLIEISHCNEWKQPLVMLSWMWKLKLTNFPLRYQMIF